MREGGQALNELSTEVKAKETHEKAVGYFRVSEQYGYKFIMEVKKIRDDRYYKELGYSNFDDYCRDAWNVERKHMDERIQIANAFSEEDFARYSGEIGHKKSLLLSRMDEQQRKQTITKGVPTNDGYKPISEATQKEISEYRRNAEEAERRAQQAEKQAEQAKKSEEIALRQLEEEQSKEPEVIERVIEDETKINQLEKQVKHIEQEKKMLENRLSLNEKDANEYRRLQDDINNLRSKRDDVVRQIDNASSIGKFIARIDRSFEEDLAPIKYSRAIEELGRSEVVQDSLENIVSKVENWCREIRGLMKDKNIVEVIDHEG